MEVGVKVVTENIREHTTRHTNTCYLTMVAMDADRRPCPVPTLNPSTPDEQRRHTAAQVRRQLRREFDARFEELMQEEQAKAGRGA